MNLGEAGARCVLNIGATPKNIPVWKSSPQVTVLEVAPSGGYRVVRADPLLMEPVPRQRDHKEPVWPFCHVKTRQEVPLMDQETSPPRTPDLPQSRPSHPSAP
jgi:hypothetical protein